MTGLSGQQPARDGATVPLCTAECKEPRLGGLRQPRIERTSAPCRRIRPDAAVLLKQGETKQVGVGGCGDVLPAHRWHGVRDVDPSALALIVKSAHRPVRIASPP